MDNLVIRLIILLIGIGLMAGYYFFMVRPKQRYRGYPSTKIRNPGVFTSKPLVPNYPNEEENYGDVVVTRRLDADGEELPEDDMVAGSGMSPDVHREMPSSAAVQEPFATAQMPQSFEPNQRDDSLTHRSNAHGNSAYDRQEGLAADEPIINTSSTVNERSSVSGQSTVLHSNPLDVDNTPAAEHDPMQNAVPEMRVETSRSKAKRFSQRAGQKFASTERQKKSTAENLIPDDAKGTSHGKLSYTPETPYESPDERLDSHFSEPDNTAVDAEKSGQAVNRTPSTVKKTYYESRKISFHRRYGLYRLNGLVDFDKFYISNH